MQLKNEKPQAVDYILGIACAVFFFAVYTLTAAPGVSFAGRTDLTLAVEVGSVPAVGGYPAYLILSKLFSLLPMGDAARQTNLFSALCGALSVFIAFFILRRYLTRNEGALFGAAALGFSSAVWARATVTGVYTFNLMLLALAFYLALGWRATGKPRHARLAALVAGVLVANDPLAAVLLLPLVLILWQPRVQRALFLQMLILFGIGLSVYLYVPLISLKGQAAEWARMLSPQRAAARAGGDFLLEGLKSGSEAVERLRSRLLPSVSQFGWVFAFIGFLGFLRSLRRRVLIHAFLLATFISLPVMLLVRRCEAVGLIPIFVFTLWVGVGMDWIFGVIIEFPRRRMAQTARVIATLLLGGILISVTIQSYRFFDRGDETLTCSIIEGLLNSSDGPAMLVSMEDEGKVAHALWLVQVSKGIGQNIIVADSRLLGMGWYRGKLINDGILGGRDARVDTTGNRSAEQQLEELVSGAENTPILVFAAPSQLEGFLTGITEDGFYPVPRGFAIELRRNPPADKIGEAQRSAAYMDLLLSEVSGKLAGSPELSAVRTYSASVSNLGIFMEDAGLTRDAELRFHQALEIDPTFAWPRILLARLLAGRGEVETALGYLREGVSVDPDNPLALLELGRALVAADSLKAGEKALLRSLYLDPNSAKGWYTLGGIYLESEQLNMALNAFERARELDPTSQFVHSCLSYMYLQLGLSDELTGEERRWLRETPDDFPARISLAKALKLNGDLEDARAELLYVIEHTDNAAMVAVARQEIGEIDQLIGKGAGSQ